MIVCSRPNSNQQNRQALLGGLLAKKPKLKDGESLNHPFCSNYNLVSALMLRNRLLLYKNKTWLSTLESTQLFKLKLEINLPNRRGKAILSFKTWKINQWQARQKLMASMISPSAECQNSTKVYSIANRCTICI